MNATTQTVEWQQFLVQCADLDSKMTSILANPLFPQAAQALATAMRVGADCPSELKDFARLVSTVDHVAALAHPSPAFRKIPYGQ